MSLRRALLAPWVPVGGSSLHEWLHAIADLNILFGRLQYLRGDLSPAAGWAADQRWTLARVASLIRRLFGVGYTLRGVSYLLHRIGWTPQVPARRAVERDEDAIAAWRTTTWAKVRG